ncbi:MAG: thiosulfate oxidation carrier protein SoxY [Rubrimonas sp.]
MKMTRRQALALVPGAAALSALGFPGAGRAATADEEITAFTGGVAPAEGRIRLTVPEIAENGNSVPVSVTVDSPMTADDHVAAVLILAAGNPTPKVATMRFGPLSGSAEAATRIRLAKTQDVIAVARMSDGSVFMDRREVKVTIGGCGG